MLRQQLYERERAVLSKYAMLCENTRGREIPMEESDIRTEYMRDRDRIVHCKSFRRLKDKTQVFISPEGSHYRTRLTHTMEVSQIARTIARCLRLNEDLTEAIALGHDLGHTPFGHAGERSIAACLGKYGDTGPAFSHNRQSLRIVEKLERGSGLNLTWEVRDGIYNHKKNMNPCTLEGMAVSFADRIAYLNHDIDDALRAGIIVIEDLPRECLDVLGYTHGARINTMITDIVEQSMDKAALSQSKMVREATELLRNFMFEQVYLNSPAKAEEKKVLFLIDSLFEYYLEHPKVLPEPGWKGWQKERPLVLIADYIAGMTDHFAETKFQELFIPHSWTML